MDLFLQGRHPNQQLHHQLLQLVKGQSAQQFQGIGSGQQTDQRSLHSAEGMGEIDLLGLAIAAVVLVHLLLGGAGQHRRQVQREDLGVEILADRQG
jgi:hypothetical protein